MSEPLGAHGHDESVVPLSIALDAGCRNCPHEVLMHAMDGDGEFWPGARCEDGDAVVMSGEPVVPASDACPCSGLVPRG